MSLNPYSNPIFGTPFPQASPQQENPPSSNESQPQVAIPLEEILQQPIMHMDVVMCYQTGNFLPLMHCYKNNLIPRDFYDSTGYHPLHTAVATNQIAVVIILLDQFHVDVNLRAANSQTALMIAANYGYNELIKILCDRGANVNEQENTKFNALMYSVKQGFVPAFAYLLSQNADINVRDENGCGVVHWAAYKNNVFMLKMLKRLGQDLNSLDNSGMTPLERAIQSEAFDAVNYLMEAGDGKKPTNLDLSQVHNQDMHYILKRKYGKSNLDKKKELVQHYVKEHRQNLTIGFYLVSWVMIMIVHVHANSIMDYNYVSNLFFIVFSLYFIGYIFFYFLKSGEFVKALGKGKKRGYDQLSSSLTTFESESSHSPSRGTELNPRMNFGALNKIAQSEVIIDPFAGDGSSFFTFLHELAYLMHSENYKEILRFDQVEHCPTCLVRRPQRSYHSPITNSCVKNFCHYSPCLGRNVTRNDHYLYLILLVQQMIMLDLFIFQLWKTFSGRVNSRILFPVEIGYVMWEEFSILYSIIYILAVVAWCYNMYFLAVEAYGVVKNLTTYEIFNGSQCKYLYKMRLGRKGNYEKKFFNPYDQGRMKNITEYVSKIFHS